MINIHEIKQLLAFYADMGMDEAIQSEASPLRKPLAPIMAQPAAAQTIAPAAPIRPIAASAAVSANVQDIVAQARTLADAATTLDALRAAVMGFDGCDLKKMAKNTVFADGNPAARIMLIGEAPGADEDIQGIPFCGASGKLLDETLAAIGLKRQENIYISNTLFWRPPGNRTPLPEELDICRPFVEKHIALIQPELLILAGATAMKSQLGISGSISRAIGKEHSYTNPYLKAPIAARVIYHPSFLLRQPLQKRETWADLLDIRQRYGASIRCA